LPDIQCVVTVFIAGPAEFCVRAASVEFQEDGELPAESDWCASFQTLDLLYSFLQKKLLLSQVRMSAIREYVGRGESFTFAEKLSTAALNAVQSKHRARKYRRAFAAHGEAS